MGTTTLKVLEELLSEAIGDFIEVNTTTNISTDNLVISTTLKEYDSGQNSYFGGGSIPGWWCYIMGTNNDGVLRQMSAYTSSTGQLTVRGAALSAESAAVSIRVGRFRRTFKTDAISRAIERVYPALYKELDNYDLVGRNLLPPYIWTSSTALYLYSATNLTSTTQTTTAGFFRQGSSSAKLIASSAGGYLSIHSDNYPRLLDMQNRSVTMKCWALPEVADDAQMVIYTKQADGTAQTLTSSTSNPAGEFTLLLLEDQALNDNLVEVDIRMKVVTNAKYVYFDMPRIRGWDVRDYLLPEDFQQGTGHLSKVFLQYDGYTPDSVDDLNPLYFREVEFFPLVSIGGYDYLKLKKLPINWRRIWLKGFRRLESLSADTDTISLDGDRLELLTAKAAEILYRRLQGSVSSVDKTRYREEEAHWANEYQRLFASKAMNRPNERLK